MSSNKVQNIIEIDDDKEEKLSKPALTTSTKTERTSTLPLKFNQSVFPKLASLLRKSAEKTHKSQTIEIIESNSPRTLTSETISNKIQPLKPDGLQKQASELTRYDPNSHHISIVEDTQPISVPQCTVILAPSSHVQSGKTSHQTLTVEVTENFVECLSVEKQNVEQNHQNSVQEIQIAPELIIVNEAEEIQGKIAQFSGKSLTQMEEQAPIPEENKNITECVQKFVPEKIIQGVAQENVKSQKIVQNEAALTQKANFLMESPEIDNSQPANTLNEDEIQPQSMKGQKPQSDAHSSFFAVQPSIQQAPAFNVEINYNAPRSAEIQIASLDNSFSKNQHISAIALQNVQEQTQIVEKSVIDNYQPVQKEAVDCSLMLMPSQIQKETLCIDKMPQIQTIQPEQNNQKPQIQTETRPQSVVSVPQKQLVQLQLPTAQIIGLIKQKIALQLPEVTQNIKTFSDEEILQIHRLLLEEKNFDLYANLSHKPSEMAQDISKQQPAKVTAQSQSVLELQKQKSVQQFEDLTDSANKMNQQKPAESAEIPEELDAIQQFEKLKNLGQEELRRKMAQYFPDSKDSLSYMNFQQLQNMVNLALAQLIRNPNKEQEVQSPVIQLPIIENISDMATVQINIDPLAENTSITKTIQQSRQTNELIIPSLEQQRAQLSQKLPQLTIQLRSISDKDLRQIVTSHAGEICNQVKQSDKKQQKDTSQKPFLLPLNPSIEQIVNQCSKWYPDLANDFKNISEEHVKQIYENVIKKLGIGAPQVDKHQSPNGKQSEKHGDSDKSQKGSSGKKGTKKAGTNLKRTYQDMAATNPREDVQRKDKKKKYTSVEIRNILICKLPQLKPNIMTLDDNEIEKIFYQSIENGKNQNVSHSPSKLQQKVHEPSKPSANSLAKNHSSESIQTNKATILPVSTNDNAHSAQVFETFDEKRQKKTRTVILVQTEVDCSEGQALSKMSKTNNEFVKRCNCDCCKKLDVNELLHRLGDLIEEKK